MYTGHLSRRFLVTVTLMCLGLFVCMGRAQTRTEPFSTIEMGLAGAAIVNHNLPHEFWAPSGGVEVSFATPFYLGTLELGGAIYGFDSEQSVPEFEAVWFYAGWGSGVVVTYWLRVEGSIRIGNFHMSFDDDSQFFSVRNESEFGLMFSTRVVLREVGPVSLFVSGSYLHVYTYLPIKLSFLTAGVSYRMNSPNWLKKVLR